MIKTLKLAELYRADVIIRAELDHHSSRDLHLVFYHVRLVFTSIILSAGGNRVRFMMSSQLHLYPLQC